MVNQSLAALGARSGALPAAPKVSSPRGRGNELWVRPPAEAMAGDSMTHSRVTVRGLRAWQVRVGEGGSTFRSTRPCMCCQGQEDTVSERRTR